MPPLIRKAPLSERIKARLNPYDMLLWLSEELHESALDDKFRDWTLPIGVAMNLVYMVARANSGRSERGRSDDLFGDFDGRGGSGWFAWFASFTAHLLALLAIFNALYTFTRTRSYRLFESNIEQAPTTPSARRVKVDSSPLSASPLSYLAAKLSATSAASRAYPSETQDVWELRIWDPRPLHLSLFAIFSPAHVLIYWLFLPTSALDPRPSVTVVTTILLAGVTSAQLLLFKAFFERKSRDERVLNKEVMHEYDTKFVHPSLNRPVRDVGTQSRDGGVSGGTRSREVDVYTPTTIINRGWKVNPNPSYAGHLGDAQDIRGLYGEQPSPAKRLPRSAVISSFGSPMPVGGEGASRYSSATCSMGMQTSRDGSESAGTPFKSRPQYQASQAQSQSQYRDRSTAPVMRGDGGSLGVFSHAASPLKKSAGDRNMPRSRGSDMDGGRDRPLGSPLKRVSMAPLGGTGDVGRSGQASLQQRLAGLRDGASSRRETGRF